VQYIFNCALIDHTWLSKAKSRLTPQARRLDVRLRAPRAPGAPERKDFVHMLNCTLSATERTLCCLLETYQTPEGVRCVPAIPYPNLPYPPSAQARKENHSMGLLSLHSCLLHVLSHRSQY